MVLKRTLQVDLQHCTWKDVEEAQKILKKAKRKLKEHRRIENANKALHGIASLAAIKWKKTEELTPREGLEKEYLIAKEHEPGEMWQKAYLKLDFGEENPCASKAACSVESVERLRGMHFYSHKFNANLYVCEWCLNAQGYEPPFDKVFPPCQRTHEMSRANFMQAEPHQTAPHILT